MTEPLMEFTIEEAVVHPQSANIPSPPRLHLGGGGDIKTFTRAVYTMVTALRPDVVFTKSYGEGTLEKTVKGADGRTGTIKPAITWSVSRRMQGGLDTTPFSPKHQRYPRLKEVAIPVPGDPTKTESVYEVTYDNEILFEISTEDKEEGEDLAEWFQDAMIIFRGYFQQMGFQHVCFSWRGADKQPGSMAFSLTPIKLYYYVQTKRYYKKQETVIAAIIVKLLSIVNSEEEAQGFEDGTLQEELFSA